MAQICWSVWLLPHAGMAVILMPCLMIQNASVGRGEKRVRLGGRGYSPSRNSDFCMPGARWQPTHMCA